MLINIIMVMLIKFITYIIYIYIYIYICFLLEIHLGGFPFLFGLIDNYRILKCGAYLVFRKISFEKEAPSWGSQAGNISQTSRPSVVTLVSPKGAS